MSSVELIDKNDSRKLLELARESIRQGLESGRPLRVNSSDFSRAVSGLGASFVTLTLNGKLRGCIGHLEARQPLVQDVAENAYLAAFRDPRFPSLSREEFVRIRLSISILNPPEAVEFDSEQELLNKLRAGIDGLILKEGHQQGTFLPSVWESLPDPAEFLHHLKQKAGLPADYWSDSIQISRYTTQSIS